MGVFLHFHGIGKKRLGAFRWTHPSSIIIHHRDKLLLEKKTEVAITALN